MTARQLGKVLKTMYRQADENEKVTSVILFGIWYNNELMNKSLASIVRYSGLSFSYHKEISKGIRLARFVVAAHPNPRLK
jgi:hydrogenase maturation factor HypF (carbamoyltransferase family)